MWETSTFTKNLTPEAKVKIFHSSRLKKNKFRLFISKENSDESS